MILKLDPRLPLVWRNPTSVQLGIDPPVLVIENVTPAHERLIAALVPGVSDAGLGVVVPGGATAVAELLAQLEPGLRVERAESATAPLIALSGVGPLVGEVARVLAGSGIRTVIADDAAHLVDSAPDLAIAVGHYVLPPALHALWLRRDVPHLPVVFSDGSATVGPMVEPGSGPCLLCLELHHRDADEAWPAMATQLLGRHASGESALLLAEVAAVVARIVLDRTREDARPSESLRIDAVTGERTIRQCWPHPDCGCHGIAHLVGEPAAANPGRAETGWAVAARRAPVQGSRTS